MAQRVKSDQFALAQRRCPPNAADSRYAARTIHLLIATGPQKCPDRRGYRVRSSDEDRHVRRVRNCADDDVGELTPTRSMLARRNEPTLLNEAGYYVPKNWTWGMSIRDRFK